MVDFPTLSDDELVQLARDYLAFHAGLVGVDLDLGDGSDADMTARLLASLQSMAQRQATALMTAASPIKAYGAFLREHATCYGIGPDFGSVGVDAIAATGYAIIVCTVGSTVVPSGLVLRAPDGQTYVTTGSATAPAAAGGSVYPGWRLGESRRVFIVGTGNGVGTTTFNPAIGDVLTAAPSGELGGVLESVSSDSQQIRFELYNDLNAVPATFSRALAVVVPITAQTAGRAGNRDPKSALTVQSPPAGVSTSASVLYCEGGRDAMTPAEMRTQLRDLFATRQMQARNSEVVDLAMSTPRGYVGAAYVMPGYLGVGSVHLITVSTFGRATSGNRGTLVNQLVRDRLPRGIKLTGSGVRELAAGSTTIDVDCAVGYGPDFVMRNGTGSLTGTYVGASAITLSGVTDATLLPRVGDRIIVAPTSVGTAPEVQKRAWIKQFKVGVVSSGGGGSYTLLLDGAINYAGASVVITPGGPMGQAVIDAIVKSYDTRVPSAPATPLVVYPDLEASTNQGALTRAIAAVPGVIDVHVSADAAYTMTGNEVWQLGPTTIRMHAS